MPNDDPWGTSTGLYTDFSGVIEDSHFGTDARYNNGETTLLLWKVRPSDIEVTTDDGTIELAYPVGGGWFSYDGGETIEHTDGKSKVNTNAVYGKIIDWALEEGLGDTLRGKGTPLEANVWQGLGFRFEEVEFNYGGEIGKKKRVMPVEVLTADGAGSAAAEDTKDTLEGFGEELKALAENSPNEEAFTESALALTGITDHANLVTRIADGSLFDELKG
jgi:hypothetical protein